MLVVAAPAHARAGRLDHSFGHRGVVTTGFGKRSSATANAVLLTPSGRIVVAGGLETASGRSEFALARYKSNGQLDRSFGRRGIVTTRFRGGGSAAALGIDGRGRLVVAGSGGSEDLLVARYLPNGRLDRSFGSDGRVRTGFAGHESSGSALVMLSGGGIIVAGGAVLPNGSGAGFLLVRYRPSGLLDRSFGHQGRAFTPLGAGADVAAAHALALWHGKVVAAGLLDNPFSGGGAFALARYDLASGKLDPSFGGDGKVTTVLGEEAGAQGVVSVGGGRMVAAGAAQRQPGQGDRFVLTRYLKHGALDSTFAAKGIATTNLPGGDALCNGLARQPDGRLVAVGQADSSSGHGSSFGVVRYLADGKLDRGFGKGGIVITGLGRGSMAAANGVITQRNGRIIVVGTNGSRFVVARYLGR
jgi:uncharacterized delta-60 repeat protein